MLIKKVFSKNFAFYGKNKIVMRAISSSIRNNQQDFVIKSKLPPLTYPNLSIDQYIWRDYEKWMNKIAVVDGITDRSMTYAQLRDKCRVLAIRLRTTLKLQPKDRIALCLPNSIEFPIIALAAMEAELSVTTINPIYTSDEIAHQLKNSHATMLFGDVSMSAVLKDAVAKTKRPMKIVFVTKSSNDSIPADGIKLNELLDSNGVDLTFLPETERDNNLISFLPYSSGTTGLSKGVMLSHKNIVTNSIVFRSEELKLASDAIGDHQDVLPCVLPFFHAYGLVVALLSKLAQGCKLVTLPKFNPDTFLNAMEKYQGTTLYLAPPIIIFFNSYSKIRPVHTQSIRYVVSGAAPLAHTDINQFLKKSPNTQYIQAFGLTETSPVTHMMLKNSKNYASIGNVVHDTEAKIVDVDDPELHGLGPNQSGELLIRGQQVMLGYYDNEKATKETITADGWLRTGDIGHYDENEEFYITDRLKELIKVKGFQVAPAELEAILRAHPEITDAGVIGIPNDSAGESPRAFVVKAKDSKLDEKTVQDYVAQKVSDYKRLTGGVKFIEAIPKNNTGKILRRELKKKYL